MRVFDLLVEALGGLIRVQHVRAKDVLHKDNAVKNVVKRGCYGPSKYRCINPICLHFLGDAQQLWRDATLRGLRVSIVLAVVQGYQAENKKCAFMLFLELGCSLLLAVMAQ